MAVRIRRRTFRTASSQSARNLSLERRTINEPRRELCLANEAGSRFQDLAQGRIRRLPPKFARRRRRRRDLGGCVSLAASRLAIALVQPRQMSAASWTSEFLSLLRSIRR
jgi:hypothetical protein